MRATAITATYLQNDVVERRFSNAVQVNDVLIRSSRHPAESCRQHDLSSDRSLPTTCVSALGRIRLDVIPDSVGNHLKSRRVKPVALHEAPFVLEIPLSEFPIHSLPPLCTPTTALSPVERPVNSKNNCGDRCIPRRRRRRRHDGACANASSWKLSP